MVGFGDAGATWHLPFSAEVNHPVLTVIASAIRLCLVCLGHLPSLLAVPWLGAVM